jgi:hypothetical protein
VTEKEKDILFVVLKNLPVGTEITLKTINEKHFNFLKIYPLYEEVQRILQENFQLFRFLTSKSLENSTVYRIK